MRRNWGRIAFLGDHRAVRREQAAAFEIRAPPISSVYPCPLALSAQAEIPRQLRRAPWHVHCHGVVDVVLTAKGGVNENQRDVMVQDVAAVTIRRRRAAVASSQLVQPRWRSVGITSRYVEGCRCAGASRRSRPRRCAALAVAADLASAPVGECATGDHGGQRPDRTLDQA